jgi:hypothetical protein
MAEFGIDSKVVFDIDGESVNSRLRGHDDTLDSHSTQLNSNTLLLGQKANQSDLTSLQPMLIRKQRKEIYLSM